MISIPIISQYRTCKEHVENNSCEYDKVQSRCSYVPLSLFEKDTMAHWTRVMASKIPFIQAFLVEYMQTFELVDLLRGFDWIETNDTSRLFSFANLVDFLKRSHKVEHPYQTK